MNPRSLTTSRDLTGRHGLFVIVINQSINLYLYQPIR